MEEIRKFIDFVRIDIEWINKNTLAAINDNRDHVIININLLLMQTFIHEFYHYKYPDLLDENEIEKLTLSKLRRLKSEDIKALALEVFSKIKFGD